MTRTEKPPRTSNRVLDGTGGPVAVRLRDVTLRDGLQGETPIALPSKIALFEAILAAGVTELELGSFVRPDRVPAMSDTAALVAATEHLGPGIIRWGLVLNERGAERAIAAGLSHLQFVVSVSEAHNLSNAGRSVQESLTELRQIVNLAGGHDISIEVTLATAFGCPFDGPIPLGKVVAVSQQLLTLGVGRITLADTIGTAVPPEVRSLVAAVYELDGDVDLGIHLHDTRGLAIANAFAAMDTGVERIDGSTGGLGGCPFAPGATGNLALEDLVHALDAMGVSTGIDLENLLIAAALACDLVGRSPQSHVAVAGPRFAGTPFAEADQRLQA